MPVWIALLRGINVGGSGKLPMKELAALLAGLECEGVRTYIQSGNAVFSHRERTGGALAGRIADAIENGYRFRPAVLLLTAAQLAAALAANPFPEGEEDPKSLHLFFMETTPKSPGLARLEALRAHGERYALVGNVCYLHAPAGIGRSKLAAGIEKTLGVPVTARNFRTAAALRELAREAG